MSRPDAIANPARRPAYRSRSAWLLLLTVLFVGLAMDLGSKYWSFHAIAEVPVQLDRDALLENPNDNPIPPHPPQRVLPFDLLSFRLVINRGAVFGLGEDQRLFFIVFTLIALGAGLYVFGRFTTERDNAAHIALGFIMAGGLGNLYDRIRYGVVRDFLHMLPDWHLPFGWRWPNNSPELFPWVFNLADVMLLIGMIALMIHINRVEKKRRTSEITPAPASAAPDTKRETPHDSSNPPATL